VTVLVFSLGPVQGFIAQARRSADGWVSSFLLSYLGCHAAMALQQFGSIEEPHLDSVPLYQALTTNGHQPDGDLTIAALSNNLVLSLRDGVNPAEAGKAAGQAVDLEWRGITKAIWEALPSHAKSRVPEGIWTRQTTSFWETYWGWGTDSTRAFQALGARKGLRDFQPAEEIGDRCTLCADREALRGDPQGPEGVRAAERRYWVAQSPLPPGLPAAVVKPGGRERLCAICLVKRLIPYVTSNPIRKLWKQPDVIFPSTSTMATVLAKAAIVKAAYDPAGDGKLRQRMDGFVDSLGPAGKAADPQDAFSAWSAALDSVPIQERARATRFLRLDGDWLLYGESVRNEHELPPESDQAIRLAHRALMREVRARAPEAIPPIYWALLAMDGDLMGKFKERLPEWSGEISRQLNLFAAEVRETVARRNGRLVYAGGDDVLAFFPVAGALEAADELRRYYLKIFRSWMATLDNGKVSGIAAPTLSGALVYAHHQSPLGVLVSRSHHLLKTAAKGEAKRNAVAIEVRTRAGAALSFARRWEDEGGSGLVARMETVLTLLSDGHLGRGFLYELRRHAEVLGGTGPFTSSDERERYVASLARKSRTANPARADEVAKALLALTGPPAPDKMLDTDPLIFARFLADGGRELR